MVLNSGSKAWLALLGGVLAYDLYAIRSGKQTLSAAFYEATRHPRRRWIVVACWSILSLHLFGLDNNRFDCFRQALMRKEQRE